MKEWHLCWLAKAGWEAHYVPHQLLASVPIVNRSFIECKNVERRNRTLLVMRNYGQSAGANPFNNEKAVSKYAADGLIFGVIIIGDENLLHPCGQQPVCLVDEARAFDARPKHSMWDHCWVVWRGIRSMFNSTPIVIRNYYHSECAALPHVITVPLGVQSGQIQSHTERLSDTRRFVFSFSSSHSTNLRTAMVSCLLREPTLRPYALAYSRQALFDALRPPHQPKSAWPAAAIQAKLRHEWTAAAKHEPPDAPGRAEASLIIGLEIPKGAAPTYSAGVRMHVSMHMCLQVAY